MKCPSLEQIYDMDLENLLSLKKHIEKNEIKFDIIPLNEDDFDLYDNNSPNDKNTIMNLINSEIKERESTKELLNFFSDLNYDDNNIEKKFLAELNSNKNNKTDLFTKNILENENKQIQEQNINLLNTNKISSQPIKLTAFEDMKTFLKRTTIDPNKLQYKVASNKYIEKFWSIDKEKKLRKKNSDISDISSNMTNLSSKINDKNKFGIKNIKGNRSRIFSEKIVIGAINIKKEKTKRKKKKKIMGNNDEGKKIKLNALELRRNYKVADVKQFLKKKTVLKPLNFSNNDKPNINCFNNELNSPNIKIFNKKSINIKKENLINEENKNNTSNIKNSNIQDEIKKDNLEKIINLLIERFNFSFEKGIFQEIKNENLNDNKKLNNKDYIIIKKLNEKNKNIFLEILNNISFSLLKIEKEEKKQENSISDKNEESKNKDSNLNYETKEQLLNINQIDNNTNKNEKGQFEQSNYNENKNNENIINEQKNEKNENKVLNLKNTNENESNNKQNILKEKEIEQNEEYEEEEEQEEEKENADKNNDKKCNYMEGLIINNYSNKNNVEIQLDKTNFHKNSLKPIKKRKLNINKNKSKQSFISNHILNDIISNNSKKDESHNFPNNILTPEQLSKSNSNLSNPNEFKKYVLSSVKPHKIISHYNYIFTKKNQRPKSSLPKNILMSTYTNIISENKELIDYSDIYSNFAELFSGYYLTNNYSEQNHFNINNAMRELYNSFNKLYHYELNHELIQQKDEMYKDIVRAEAGVIINRIKHAQEKLLKEEDININVEKYCLLKKCLELERKNYARDNNAEINNINNNTPKSKYKKFFRVVLSRPEIYDIVCYTLYKDSTWSELPHGLSMGQCWNLYWSYCPPNIDFTNLFSFQKVNHLINNRIVHRKDLLHKHIMRVRRLNKKNNEMFDIMPLTFLLSKEYVNFVEEFHKYKETDDDNIWIVKPVGKSRGKGIFLINNISDVPLNDTFLVQKYLSKPLLLDEGYKFDMRIYCLITSVNPLEMFLYKDGFARVSNELYNMDITNIKVHLTNAAIQNKNAKKSTNYEKIYGGSKISLDMLRTKLARQYNIDFDYLIWPQVKDIIIKVFACCQNDMPYCPSTFEMFGFDVIIDTNFRCWLLEINSSPSLERTNVLDDEIKLPLVKDIIKIIEPIDVDKLALLNVLERIIKIKNNTKNKDVYLYSPKVQLNMDLNNIFKGKMPRKYGEVPKDLGRFEMICPNKDTDRIIKMAGGQKFYNNKREKRK